jgi:hypothetical protein
VEQGWATFAGAPRLVVDVRYPEPSIMPPDVMESIRAFLENPDYAGGFVEINADPQVDVPSIREVITNYEGTVCPDCLAETGWDEFQWRMFLAGFRMDYEQGTATQPREPAVEAHHWKRSRRKA